jgi:hypothetical protein
VSGTIGELLAGACVRLMPSMFRISPHGRCAFTGTLSFVGGLWRVSLPHLYTALPRNASMKVRKDQLRAKLEKGH